jgi:AbiV family abortive infection protein
MSSLSKQNSGCKPKPPRQIPKGDFPKGIDLCKQNIADFLGDARNILNSGKPYHAYVSFQFALEEFGKILMLKDALTNPKNTSTIAFVDEQVFTTHRGKSEKAIAYLGQQFKTLYDGVWAKGVWAPGIWYEAEAIIGHDTRTKCAFVDYINNNWVVGDKAITNQNLTVLINELDNRTKLE